jgi:hypothetical protein
MELPEQVRQFPLLFYDLIPSGACPTRAAESACGTSCAGTGLDPLLRLHHDHHAQCASGASSMRSARSRCLQQPRQSMFVAFVDIYGFSQSAARQSKGRGRQGGEERGFA